MAKKKLQPITINDLLAYRFPGNLQYSPDGKYIAFQCSRPDGVKNDYRQDVWLVRDGKAKQLTYSLDTTVAFWENEETLIVQRVCPEAAGGTSSLFAIDMQGGEALPWQVLPFPLKQIKKVREGVYAALGMIDANDPDAYLDDEKTRDSKAAAREAEKNAAAKKRAAKTIGGTVAGTVGREVGKTVGGTIGGKFGKTLGGNLGSSLGRGILNTLFGG